MATHFERIEADVAADTAMTANMVRRLRAEGIPDDRIAYKIGTEPISVADGKRALRVSQYRLEQPTEYTKAQERAITNIQDVSLRELIRALYRM